MPNTAKKRLLYDLLFLMCKHWRPIFFRSQRSCRWNKLINSKVCWTFWTTRKINFRKNDIFRKHYLYNRLRHLRIILACISMRKNTCIVCISFTMTYAERHGLSNISRYDVIFRSSLQNECQLFFIFYFVSIFAKFIPDSLLHSL